MAGCPKRTLWTERGGPFGTRGLGERQVDVPLEPPARERLARPPDPDEQRQEDDVARAAEVRVLLDEQRCRSAALDPEAKAQRGRHDWDEANRELERLAHVGRADGGEPQKPVGRDLHLQPEVQAERLHARQRASSLEELHAGLDGDALLRIHEHRLA